MLDLNALGPAARRLYAKLIATNLLAGESDVRAEQLARETVASAGYVAKSQGEPARVAKRLEVVKTKPELADEIGQDNADAVRFLALYNARRSSNPKARPGEIHSELAREFPRLAHAYRAIVTG